MASKRKPFPPTRLPGVGAGLPPSRSFTPYRPPPLPTGTYDPALDAQRAASSRGLLDTTQDTGLAGTRAAEDYGIQLGQLQQQQGRVDADYASNVQALTRNYSNLATAQGERANQYGVVPGSGALLQAAQKRAANQQIAQTALDTAHTRATGDINTQIGSIGLTLDRGVTDRTTGLSRAGREDRTYGLDIESEKAFQAGQAGYAAPGRGEPGGLPANEFVDAAGNHRRIIVSGGVRSVVRPDGSVISSAPVHPASAPHPANVQVGVGAIPPKKRKR